MKLNEAGLKLIKDFEGFSSSPYLCPAGVPTIGYGTTVYPNGEKVTMEDRCISEEYATELLREHNRQLEDAIRNFLVKKKIALNDNQYSALISFAYNLGWSWVIFKGSVREALIQGRLDDVPKNMMKFTKARVNGELVELEGLIRRRQAEVDLYNS